MCSLLEDLACESWQGNITAERTVRGLLVSQIQRGPERAVETLQLLASGVLPLFCLAVGDVGQYASQAFCHQDVAADGAYSTAACTSTE